MPGGQREKPGRRQTGFRGSGAVGQGHDHDFALLVRLGRVRTGIRKPVTVALVLGIEEHEDVVLAVAGPVG